MFFIWVGDEKMVIVTTDEIQAKKQLNEARRKWLKLHRNDLDRWIYDNMSYDERKYLKDQAFSNEILTPFLYSITLQSLMTNDEKLDKIINPFFSRGHIMIVLGGRGSGKTSLAYILCEYLAKRGDNIWWFGLPTNTPSFVKGTTMNFNAIPENSTTIMDESSVNFYNRLAMTKGQRDVMRVLPIIRHSKRNFIVIAQAEKILDIGFMTNASSIVWTSPCPFPFMQTAKDTVDNRLIMFVPTESGRALYYSDDHLLQFDYHLPQWWSDKYSLPYSRLTKEQGMRTCVELIKNNVDPEMIVTQLSMRGVDVDHVELAKMRELVNRSPDILSMSDKDLYNFISHGFDDTPLGETKRGRKYNFRMTKVQQAEWNIRMMEDPRLDVLLSINANDILEHDLRYLTKKMNVIMSIYGLPGTGKSWALLSLAEFISKITKHPFPPENSCHMNYEIEKRLQEVKRDATLTLNEQLKSWGTGSGRRDQELSNMEQTMRRKKINFLYASPDLHTHLHNFILETYGIDERNGVAKFVLYTPSKKVLGYVTLRKPSKKMIEEFEKADEKFKDKVVERTTSANTQIADYVKEFMSDPVFKTLTSQGQKITYIKQKKPNLTVAEQTDIFYSIQIEEKKLEA